MKTTIHELILDAWKKLEGAGSGQIQFNPGTVENTRDSSFGDYASNIAMLNAKGLKKAPREIAQKIIDQIAKPLWIKKIEIAGPGFINFYLDKTAWQQIIPQILEAKIQFGCSQQGQNKKVQIEFVSANPTGPLHVGHGRGAAYGSAVANLLESQGYKVHREYYVNDAGRQMDILAASVYLRYLELCGQEVVFPSNGYKGDYVWDIAAQLHREYQERFRKPLNELFLDVPEDEIAHEDKDAAAGQIEGQSAKGDKEKHIDAIIQNLKQLLGSEEYRLVFDTGLEVILNDIRDDLHNFGVDYQEWFSERTLTATGALESTIEKLKSSSFTHMDSGALWFRSSEFGDEKDRVLVRENGQMTYFAADIAYHMNKMDRDFDRLINIWGADHHGYVARVKAGLKALGQDTDKLNILLVQFAILYKNGERMQMSTRSGEFVTLRQLRKEVGRDAARFFYVMRKCEQHLDFDLDLATSKTNENPVYYVQYAHARICSVMRQAQEKNLYIELNTAEEHLDVLIEDNEIRLMKKLIDYPEILMNAAKLAEPHLLAQYLRDLAAEFHAYYNACSFLVEDAALRDARLKLIQACRIVFHNGLALLGISAPEQM